MAKDTDFHMWTYWRDKKGLDEALKEYYPNTLKSDPTIQHAYHSLRMAEQTINRRMEVLANKEEEDEANGSDGDVSG